MKERILKVIMICAFLFAVGFTLFIAVVETKSTLIAILFGIGAIAISSGLQYIVLGKWHPLYLFGDNQK